MIHSMHITGRPLAVLQWLDSIANRYSCLYNGCTHGLYINRVIGLTCLSRTTKVY